MTLRQSDQAHENQPKYPTLGIFVSEKASWSD